MSSVGKPKSSPEAPPVGYVLYHCADGKGARWRRVAESRSHAELVARMTGPGDWWIAPIRDPQLLAPATRQPTLFD